MRSPTSTSKIALAISLSIAVHSLLLIKGSHPTPILSQHSIIHARLDKQDRELVQQEQVGQIAQQHNEQISEASTPSKTAQDEPLQREITQAQEKIHNQPIISSKSESDKKALSTPTEDVPIKKVQETKLKELVEKVDVAATQPNTQQSNQVNSDSRAQVKALEGSEDPTYTSYRRVLQQYLEQRLEAKAEYQGRVRLKIRLEYGSVATSINVIQSSGDLEIDDWAKKAALAANPYPKIPKEIGSIFEFSPTLQFGKTQ